MGISFCDRCDGSIPAGDLESGAAAKRRGALLCGQCLSMEARRGRTTAFVGVASLLLAAALGALAAWLLLGPRIRAQRTEMDALRVGMRDLRARAAREGERGADRDAALRQVIDALRRLRETVETASLNTADSIGKLSSRLGSHAREIAVLERYVKQLSATAAGAPEPGDVDTWLTLLDSENAGVRHSALVALAGEDDERVSRGVLAALDDPEAEIRALAAEMAGERGLDASLPKLVKLLEDPSDHVRETAGRSLDRISGVEFGFDATASEAARKAVVERATKWLGARSGGD